MSLVVKEAKIFREVLGALSTSAVTLHFLPFSAGFNASCSWLTCSALWQHQALPGFEVFPAKSSTLELPSELSPLLSKDEDPGTLPLPSRHGRLPSAAWSYV